MLASITLASEDLQLEAMLNTRSRKEAVLVTHPHPLYGGDMHNAVVATIARAYEKTGWSSLRFNFRGAGASQGGYDEGVGEQRDLRAAIAFLRNNGFETIDLAGYSFGAWIIARWSRSCPEAAHRIFLVAPPVVFLDFSQIRAIPGLQAVFAGSRDAFGPPGETKTHLARWQPRARLSLIQGADHFFSGRLDQHETALAQAI